MTEETSAADLGLPGRWSVSGEVLQASRPATSGETVCSGTEGEGASKTLADAERQLIVLRPDPV